MRPRIFLSPPHLSGKEYETVEHALKSNWIAPAGPAVTEFERLLCDYNQVDHCLAVSSGTAAIHLALLVLGVQQGDEVICPTFTFSGSCNPVVYQQATPVFVDSEMESWNMDPLLLETAIKDRIKKGKKPKAIIVVHLFGMMANMNAILAIAHAYDIPVIEDAAEALGSAYEGTKSGSLGDIGVYSFNGNKIITTSGGGALVSKRKEWIDQARYLSNQAKSAKPYYHHEAIGYNYQLSNISAAIGVAQMDVLDRRVEKRRQIFSFYKNKLTQVGIFFQRELPGVISNRWLTTVLIESGKESINESLRQAFEKENIETRLLWKPMHLQPSFAGSPSYLSGVSESLFAKGLCLPSGSSLSDDELALIIEIFNKRLLY
jgi:dTDP-4-amino-4,6-dideoxygalactose transaminase